MAIIDKAAYTESLCVVSMVIGILLLGCCLSSSHDPGHDISISASSRHLLFFSSSHFLESTVLAK